MQSRSTRSHFFDGIGCIVTALTILGLILFPVVGASVRAMYLDFGTESLPPLTDAVTRSWLAPLGSCGPLAFLLYGLSSTSGSRRR